MLMTFCLQAFRRGFMPFLEQFSDPDLLQAVSNLAAQTLALSTISTSKVQGHACMDPALRTSRLMHTQPLDSFSSCSYGLVRLVNHLK